MMYGMIYLWSFLFLLRTIRSNESGCQDDNSTDCAKLDKMFDICEDIHDAKLICRKFCNLCSLVDGKWAGWSQWSACDVTCGEGMHTRARTCTNPAPTNQGLECEGEKIDTKPCKRPSCPVHGGWSNWCNWSACPVTCGLGMQKRERNCSNPYPLRYGDHCFGDAVEYRSCGQKLCDVNGYWAHWSSWTSCDVTCGKGRKLRTRRCTNPRPENKGRDCIGVNLQSSQCSAVNCPATRSAFSVTKPSSNSVINGIQKLTFSSTIYKYGNDFSTSTGTYTCRLPGVYHFSVTLVKKRASSRVDRASCHICKNRQSMIYIEVDPTDDDTDKGNAAISQSIVINLDVGDIVYLCGCSDPSTRMEHYTSFTGFLLYHK